MRSALACPRCRRSKVKCIHNGTAPCRACRGSMRESACILSTPERKNRDLETGPRKRIRLDKEKENSVLSTVSAECIDEPVNSEAGKLHGRRVPTQHSVDVAGFNLCSEELGSSPLEIRNPVKETPLPLLIEASWHLVHRSPGVSFIHTPTFFQSLRDGCFDELKVCAILAVCARFIPELVSQHGSVELAGKFYANFVYGELDAKIRQGPHLETIQCLLLIGMYEWGESSGFNAWMYVGMAIRMCQALAPNSESTCVAGGKDGESKVIENETRDRTIWSCYAMDRVMSCGKNRPTTFLSADMRIPLPLSEADYAFGEIKEPRKNMSSITAERRPSESLWTIEHHFAVIIQGLDIWSNLAKWTTDGGIRKYHSPNDYPWNSNSAWNKIGRDLEIWRSHQDDRLKYSPAKLAAQVHRGDPEPFVFINLLYYLCRMFLHREFMPLLPLRQTKPSGPIDLPSFQAGAPPGWWESSAEILHDAADSVGEILTELGKTKYSLMSPLVGFCAFSAALTHAHAAAFPHMRLNGSSKSTAKYEKGMAYLTACAEKWKIAEAWVTTLVDTNRLFKRALSNKHKEVDGSVSLGEKGQEYGSIVSVTPSPQTSALASPTNDSREYRHAGQPNTQVQPFNPRLGDNAITDFTVSDVQPALDLGEEFWRMNETLLGQQFVNSFNMGNYSSIFGDHYG